MPLNHQDLKSFWDYFNGREEFDSAGFLMLCEDIDENTVAKILGHFQETLQESLAKVEVGIAKNHNDHVWQACHKVAGSAELIGFKLYGSLSRGLSHRLREEGSFAEHARDLAEFIQKTKFLIEQLGKLCPLKPEVN